MILHIEVPNDALKYTSFKQINLSHESRCWLFTQISPQELAEREQKNYTLIIEPNVFGIQLFLILFNY